MFKGLFEGVHHISQGVMAFSCFFPGVRSQTTLVWLLKHSPRRVEDAKRLAEVLLLLQLAAAPELVLLLVGPNLGEPKSKQISCKWPGARGEYRKNMGKTLKIHLFSGVFLVFRSFISSETLPNAAAGTISPTSSFLACTARRSVPTTS